VSRSRNLLFAANDGSGTIAAFTVNPFSGALRAVPGSRFPFRVGVLRRMNSPARYS
jgi:hypothetical protein